MKGKYRAVIALLLLVVLLPLALLLTAGYWLPTLAGVWLPQGTRIALEQRPRLTRSAIVLPDLRYFAGDCELAHAHNVVLSHPTRWRLHLDALTLNTGCFSAIPDDPAPGAPRTLAQWQAMLPESEVEIARLKLADLPDYDGALRASLSPQAQVITFTGDKLAVSARLEGQALKVERLRLYLFDGQPPVSLLGDFTLGLMPDGIPTKGEAQARFSLPQAPHDARAEVTWRGGEGQLLLFAQDDPDPLLDLPWQAGHDSFAFSDGRWRWPYEGFPLSGRAALRVENWRGGLDAARISGRVNVVTQGNAGKGNAVMTFGPGTLSLRESAMPLRITGEAKQDALAFYASLPAILRGPLLSPALHFMPGALLRSRGRVIDALNIEEIRWPLAGVTVTEKGIDGRLQAIARASEPGQGDMLLHLDGRADDFLPDAGLWRWRYWGNGTFEPMQSRWSVGGRGEWRDEVITLSELNTRFDKWHYGSMTVDHPQLALSTPVRWARGAATQALEGALKLDAGATRFTSGASLPPSTLNFSVQGRDPSAFQFKGDLHAGEIGPVRVNGRWDGERLRGQAWWSPQPLAVFQPLLPPDWKLLLRDGGFYAQVAFSAAAGQGFEAGGHGVVKQGSAWTKDNEFNGVDFVLPFRFRDSTWQLGTRGPVRLNIAEIQSQVPARDITASLQGGYPWSEANPLVLSDVSASLLGGKIRMQQLRLPQHTAALLRLENISSSELITATNVKQVALSGAINGALPLWVDNPQWIVHDGWLTSPGPLTLRMDKEMADAMARDNAAAAAAVNWLRYMEISRSWTRLDVDNLGVLRMRSEFQGESHVDGKTSGVRLNYQHQENLFTLWRSLRFGDNLQSWLEQHATLPAARCKATSGKTCEEQP
ncbi:YdbH family protein [Cronobacter malonaticus]|uniref:YdbH family protein n=1 Tax=Cronobacter malonaticus TaxID=413503 RepID=UPI0028954EB8|nr:YdbH family protein [Cronobacter malonaticus]MDT3621355.1 YdbH family protein [Cronobacter malonaticus]